MKKESEGVLWPCLTNQMQVIVDQVGIHLRGQLIEVDDQPRQVTAVVGKGTLTLAQNGDFLLKPGQ